MSRSHALIAALAFALALAAGAAACHEAADLTDPGVIAMDLKGTWAESFSVPGASTVFALAVSDTTISGTGTYAIEAGRSGTLTVSGVISGRQALITFVRDYGLRGHFNATLASADVLTGALWYESQPVSDPVMASFHRTARRQEDLNPVVQSVPTGWIMKWIAPVAP